MSLPGSTLSEDEVRALYTEAVSRRQSPVRARVTFINGATRDCRLFEDNHGRMCTTAPGLRKFGYHVDQPGHRITKCVLLDNAEEARRKRMAFARSVIRRRHPNLWTKFDGMDAEAISNEFSNSNLYFVNLRKRLPDFAYAGLVDAVARFDSYTRSLPGKHMSAAGRDLRVEVRPAVNRGGLEAWFSSEFRGCGNGSYYLIIAPDWAAHCEND